MKCECGGQVEGGRCLSCFTETECCGACHGQLNRRGRCTDYTCYRFGLLPGQEEPRSRDDEYDTESRAWAEYYRSMREPVRVHVTHTYDGE